MPKRKVHLTQKARTKKRTKRNDTIEEQPKDTEPELNQYLRFYRLYSIMESRGEARPKFPRNDTPDDNVIEFEVNCWRETTIYMLNLNDVKSCRLPSTSNCDNFLAMLIYGDSKFALWPGEDQLERILSIFPNLMDRHRLMVCFIERLQNENEWEQNTLFPYLKRNGWLWELFQAQTFCHRHFIFHAGGSGRLEVADLYPYFEDPHINDPSILQYSENDMLPDTFEPFDNKKLFTIQLAFLEPELGAVCSALLSRSDLDLTQYVWNVKTENYDLPLHNWIGTFQEEAGGSKSIVKQMRGQILDNYALRSRETRKYLLSLPTMKCVGSDMVLLIHAYMFFAPF